jgi:hypothetical protein
MLEILQQKLLSWTPELSDSFYNNVARVNQDGDRMWEIAPTGFFLIGAGKAEYRDYNGKTYSLEYGDRTELYIRKKQLSDLSDTNKTVAIEKPTLIELHSIMGLVITYVEQSRPYNSYGIPFENLIAVEDKLTALREIFPKFLMASEQLIQVIDIAAGDLKSHTYPLSLNGNPFYDPVTKNIFWAGPMKFTYSREEYLERFKLMTENIENLLGVEGSGFKNEMVNIVNTQCSIHQYP